MLNEAKPPALDESTRALDARNAFVMTSLLQEVTRSGTAARAQGTLKRPDIYGKTGTTNDSIDAWFAGWQRNVVAVVWMGYDNAAQAGRPRDRRRPVAAGLDRLHERTRSRACRCRSRRRPRAWSTSAASGTTTSTPTAPASAAWAWRTSCPPSRRRRGRAQEHPRPVQALSSAGATKRSAWPACSLAQADSASKNSRAVARVAPAALRRTCSESRRERAASHSSCSGGWVLRRSCCRSGSSAPAGRRCGWLSMSTTSSCSQRSTVASMRASTRRRDRVVLGVGQRRRFKRVRSWSIESSHAAVQD